MGGLKCGIHLQIVEVNNGIKLTQVSLQKKTERLISLGFLVLYRETIAISYFNL